MAINFPDAPDPGQAFVSGGWSWTWDGAKWVQTSGSGSGGLPDAPNDGKEYARQSIGWVEVFADAGTY